MLYNSQEGSEAVRLAGTFLNVCLSFLLWDTLTWKVKMRLSHSIVVNV